MNYPGIEAYHFPVGDSHESPCMDLYFRSKEYQEKKEGWMRDAGIFKEWNKMFVVRGCHNNGTQRSKLCRICKLQNEPNECEDYRNLHEMNVTLSWEE